MITKRLNLKLTFIIITSILIFNFSFKVKSNQEYSNETINTNDIEGNLINESQVIKKQEDGELSENEETVNVIKDELNKNSQNDEYLNNSVLERPKAPSPNNPDTSVPVPDKKPNSIPEELPPASPKPPQEEPNNAPPPPVRINENKNNEKENQDKKSNESKSIKLPEVSDSEIQKFESFLPQREKMEKRSNIVRGIISILLVISGISMIIILLISNYSNNSKNKKENKTNDYEDYINISNSKKILGGDVNSEMDKNLEIKDNFENIYKD